MARERYLVGVNEEELKPSGPPEQPTTPKGRWENFWYHYKAQTIIAAVLIITVVISVTQLFKRETYDYTVMYAGPQGVAVQDAVYIEKAFAEIGKDRTGDGKVIVAVSDLLMLSDEEIADARAKGIDLDVNFVRNSKTEFSQQIVGGDAVICMVSPYVHGLLVEAGGLMKLTDILGEAPENSYGAYGIKLSDTDFGSYFNGIRSLPDDTVLCIRSLSTAAKLKGEKKTKAIHADNVELFKRMVAFEAPEVESPS